MLGGRKLRQEAKGSAMATTEHAEGERNEQTASESSLAVVKLKKQKDRLCFCHSSYTCTPETAMLKRCRQSHDNKDHVTVM